MGQSIQEWTRENLWKTAFKKFEGVRQTIPLQIFSSFFFFKWLSSTNFTLSILEYFVPYLSGETSVSETLTLNKTKMKSDSS